MEVIQLVINAEEFKVERRDGEKAGTIKEALLELAN
jgi:hypothetical protein